MQDRGHQSPSRTVRDDLPEPIDHVMLIAGGSYYAAVAQIDFAQVRRVDPSGKHTDSGLKLHTGDVLHRHITANICSSSTPQIWSPKVSVDRRHRRCFRQRRR